jgi:hypothetical protein
LALFIYMELKTYEDKVRIDSDYIEAGELANEIGKIYQKRLDEFIHQEARFKKEKLYFVVQTEKDPSDLSKVVIRMASTDKYFPELKESTDFWSYDYASNKKEVEWSVPSRIDMKNFLRAEHKYHKDTIKWIKKFLEQHPEVNLKDKSAKIIK